MTEERSERIRELNRSIEQWQRVHDHELRELRGTQTDFKATQKLTSRVVLLGSPPAIVIIICWCLANTGTEPVWEQVLVVCAGLFLYAVVATGAARASGLVAHYWFHRSFIEVRVAAIIVSLAATLFMLWWVLELCVW